MFGWSNLAQFIFFNEFKRIYDKITYLDKIFEMKFNFWYFMNYFD